MSIQVQELIDKIKSEGVDAAKAASDKLIAEAEAKAKAIIAEAEVEAHSLRANASSQAARETAAGREALAQASRDLLLLLGKEIQKLLDGIVSREVKGAYSAEALKEILPGLIASWKRSEGDDLAILLSPEDLAKLDSFFKEKLKTEIFKGVELLPVPGLKAGFQISQKAGAVYYDFSAHSLSELLARHLNPALAEVMKQAVREQ
jgi:V/A-type H+-transporting ATPase subunit E